MPESVKRRGSSGPTIGATDRSCWSGRSSVVAIRPQRLRADRDPHLHRLLRGLALVDLDERPRPHLDERALGLAGLDLDRPLEGRLLDLLQQFAVLAEVHAEDLDPDVALALLALEAQPDDGLAAGLHAALHSAERDRPVGVLDHRRAGAGRRVLV